MDIISMILSRNQSGGSSSSGGIPCLQLTTKLPDGSDMAELTAVETVELQKILNTSECAGVVVWFEDLYYILFAVKVIDGGGDGIDTLSATFGIVGNSVVYVSLCVVDGVGYILRSTESGS